MSSSEAYRAKPLRRDETSLHQHLRTVEGLIQQGHLPDFDAQCDWRVFTVRGTDFGSHESVVISQDGSHFTTVELGVDPDPAVPHDKYITPKVLPYTRSRDSLVEQGTVRSTLRLLFCLHLKVCVYLH